MTKSELIRRIAHEQSLLARRDVELAVKVMLEHMTARLAAGGRIEIRGFGSFSLHFRRGLLAAGRAQPQDRDTGSASLEVRPKFQAGPGTSRAPRSAGPRSAWGLRRQGMTTWQTRTRGRRQSAVRGPHEHGPGGLEIPEPRRCGGAGTGTPSDDDLGARRAKLLHGLQRGGDPLGLRPSPPRRRRLAGPGADVAVGVRAEPLDDVAVVGEATGSGAG